MKRKFLKGIFIVTVFLLLSVAVMLLWNLLLPQIVHFGTINYWQALALMALCRILFGGFNFGGLNGRGRGDRPPRRLKDKLMRMDEGDREAFKEEWRKRGAHHRHD